ncbi:MAG: M24 family metallopeptidase [Acidimicrobiales bacterium]
MSVHPDPAPFPPFACFDPAAFPPLDHAGRLQALRASLAEAGCDALLVAKPAHVRYLTGFTGSAGLLLLGADDALLVTDGRYRDQASEELRAAGVEAELGIGVTALAQRELVRSRAAGRARVGLEAGSITWSAQRSYALDWFPDAELVPTDGLVEALRAVKDAGELARIEAACAVADAALAAVRPLLGEEVTEAEFAAELDHAMRRRGASDRSFDTIVASGPHAALPHHRPGPRRIVEGDLVVIDFGALVDGYHSDMTRTVSVGPPGEVQARLLEVVAAAQAAGAKAVAPGVTAAAVDGAARSVIEAAGWGEQFAHGTGHGVGLEIHEAPAVGATSAATLALGQVVTVEPGVYLAQLGGVRIEDTLVVTPGGARTLTLAPKTTTV